ncbi:hypothetical protein [Micromonospora sp. NPDC005806]|uniref:NADH-quinone oxidoreductase subunit D-related protein n=1 Tax=Micromonospora sp. NPDC005806 TaxID=3364234 RepID=UPI0036CC1C0E
MVGLIGKIRSLGRVAERAPGASAQPLPAAAALDGSAQVRHVDAGSCNGCEIEIGSRSARCMTAERHGVRLVASPRHADVLTVTGPVTVNMAGALRKTYEARLDALTIPVHTNGDVLARFLVRADEIRTSAAILTALLPTLTSGTAASKHTLPAPGRRAADVGIVEGWRGAITHRVELNPDGAITRAKIVDPSFFNWPALPVALADTIVPDFPSPTKLQPLLRRKRPLMPGRSRPPLLAISTGAPTPAAPTLPPPSWPASNTTRPTRGDGYGDGDLRVIYMPNRPSPGDRDGLGDQMQP